MNEPECKDCQYFIQHYGLDNRRLYRIFCGHCIFRKTRTKQPDAHACEHFLPAPPVNTFVTKEYLSKELLQYVLNLDLLPEIE